MFGWLKSRKTAPAEKPIEPVAEDFTDASAVLDMFTRHSGIHFRHKEPIVNTKLAHFCRNRQIPSFRELYSRLIDDADLLQELVNYLTVNETYFFREIKQIDYLAHKTAESKKKIRILCAPGSTGEEPYSIAIKLLEQNILPSYIEIVSLDINSEAVSRAKEGIYSPRALHKTSPEIEERYFIKEEGYVRVKEEIKKLVRFHVANVFDEAQLRELGTFDCIFSRNMLIYFDPPIANKAIGNLIRLARSKETRFFFGHADIITPPPLLEEHLDAGIKFYTPAEWS